MSQQFAMDLASLMPSVPTQPPAEAAQFVADAWGQWEGNERETAVRHLSGLIQELQYLRGLM